MNIEQESIGKREGIKDSKEKESKDELVFSFKSLSLHNW
jgi:hypothetical protein